MRSTLCAPPSLSPVSPIRTEMFMQLVQGGFWKFPPMVQPATQRCCIYFCDPSEVAIGYRRQDASFNSKFIEK